jgi:hypothetical protein
MLTFPLALLGLVGVPLLVGIYLLRNRFRRQPVSSLMLWLDTREARTGGTRIRRLQTPLLFALESLAILLLVLAAAEPRVRLSQSARPLVVILDDSFSMLAGGDQSPRQEALRALHDLLRKRPPSTIRFVLAGEKPQTAGDLARSPDKVDAILDGWRCRAPTARLDQAITLAADLGGDLGLLLVLTDHPPEVNVVPAKGRLQWWSFGRPCPNFAFVQAARTSRDGVDRCLLEIANLSGQRGDTTMTVEAGGEVLRRSAVSLEAGQTERIILQLRPECPALHASLEPDALAIDNDVVLLPGGTKPVRVALQIGNKELPDALSRAIKAARNAILTDTRPELVFTDTAGPVDPADAMVVRFVVEKEAEAYRGPFVLDRTHPLTEGLALRGVIWGAGKSEELDGNPVIMAGNILLLTDTETQSARGITRHELHWRLRPDLSTLQDCPDWPILIWNILHWRSSQASGPDRTNLRLGETVTVAFPTAPRSSVQLTGPGGIRSSPPIRGRFVTLRPDDVGSYTLRAGESEYAFAVNALNRDESDLTECAPGQWGDWLDETSLQLEYRSVAWVVLLVLLGVLTLHLLLAAKPLAA